MHFKTPQNEIKCVLSIKKSNFKAQNGSTFSHLLTGDQIGTVYFVLSPNAISVICVLTHLMDLKIACSGIFKVFC